MEDAESLLDDIRRKGLGRGHFLGMLHVLVGRKVFRGDGSLVTSGLTWRHVATLLRQLRWDKEAVRELGLNPDDLAPRDRQRYWYSAIAQAHLESPEAIAAGDRFVKELVGLGFVVEMPAHASS